MIALFWKDALALCRPTCSVARASFEAAERLDALLDLGIEAWGSVKHALRRSVKPRRARCAGRLGSGDARRTGCCRCIEPRHTHQAKKPASCAGFSFMLTRRQKVSDPAHPAFVESSSMANPRVRTSYRCPRSRRGSPDQKTPRGTPGVIVDSHLKIESKRAAYGAGRLPVRDSVGISGRRTLIPRALNSVTVPITGSRSDTHPQVSKPPCH